MMRSVKPLIATVSLGIAILIGCHAHTSENAATSQPAAVESHDSAQRSGSLKSVGTIHLPGNGGFTDYMVISADMHRLYAGYRTENELVVVDTQTNSVVASIGGLSKVCSVALVPDRNLGFTSNRGEDTVGVIDLTTNKLLRKIPGGHGPDAIIYNPAAKLVCVSNHEGRGLTLIDVLSEKGTTID